ncbi:very-long-chain (3R)-3-hydroxyacyl-CoA dehydratase hpo-8 [Onthophagus taurus]|uniref:very-long-chain (3R)-3-hydroxyacyl-CoA dehydratase hpo-8 n=1 Tax=Onthophagus taurus TaxID=166361 RepID=UPI000C20A254|nr:very-long-chain (3R)-3-hydroxyacyl-CoA dehydratase 2 [Onthophagus taurus]
MPKPNQVESKKPIRSPAKEMLIKAYLLSYNFIQTLGWSYLLYQIFEFYLLKREGTLYDQVGTTLLIFQNAAILEAVNAIYKLISSNPAIVIPQIYSRIFVVCGILLPLSDSQSTIGFPLLLFAWSITEIIRYSTYTLNLINIQLYILKWLRYTLFIALYPIGVTGELLCMYWAVMEVSRTKLWCWELPNKYNVVFYYHFYIVFNMILYIPIFPQLYLHMFSQRRKVLGASTKKTN